MDFLLVSKFQNNQDNEEEDYGSFFLQPALSPYNITEKVEQANFDLFNTNFVIMDKTPKVTFREELASYEPELLTDDDVNSIESDQVIDNEQISENNSQILELSNNENAINLNIFDIKEDDESAQELDDVIEDFDEEISEKLLDSLEDDFREQITDGSHRVTYDYNNVASAPISTSILSEINNESSKNKSDSRTSSRKRARKKSNYTHVDCKSHCIERLDFDLSMSIKKLDIQEKPPNCPLLKLQTRKCCDENRMKNCVNLPCYNGHRSEYGLSSLDLEKREKRKEMMKLKEQKREQLMREYQSRRNQQNEEVFCQWLKDIAKRKNKMAVQKRELVINAISSRISGSARKKECFSPSIISFPTKAKEKAGMEQVNNRPKTANEFVPRHSIKKSKRPTSCVFIQVPQRLLERGINIGDLLVTDASFNAKKMHILAVSSPKRVAS